MESVVHDQRKILLSEATQYALDGKLHPEIELASVTSLDRWIKQEGAIVSGEGLENT
ncbi:MAG: hypothetical protein ACOCXQ_04675 [Patescibacteria group bacterium]